MATTSFRVAFVIKGNKEEAEKELVKRLNEWFLQDFIHDFGGPPSKPGTLLWYGIKDDEIKELP